MGWFPNFCSNSTFKSLLSGASSTVGEANVDADSENSEGWLCGQREVRGDQSQGALGTGWTVQSGLSGGVPVSGQYFCSQWREHERIRRPVLREELQITFSCHDNRLRLSSRVFESDRPGLKSQF